MEIRTESVIQVSATLALSVADFYATQVLPKTCVAVVSLSF